jgi:hypothetical protein
MIFTLIDESQAAIAQEQLHNVLHEIIIEDKVGQ